MNAIPVGYRRRQKLQYGTIVLVAMTFVVMVFLARSIFSPTPEKVIDPDGRCIAIELAGEYYPCQDPRFVGANMDATYVAPGLKLDDLRRMSKK